MVSRNVLLKILCLLGETQKRQVLYRAKGKTAGISQIARDKKRWRSAKVTDVPRIFTQSCQIPRELQTSNFQSACYVVKHVRTVAS